MASMRGTARWSAASSPCANGASASTCRPSFPAHRRCLPRRRSSTCWRASCACTGTTPTSNCSARTSFPCMPAAWATPGLRADPGLGKAIAAAPGRTLPAAGHRRAGTRLGGVPGVPRPATRQRRAHRAAPATHRYRRSPVLRRGRRRPLRLPGPGRAPACPGPLTRNLRQRKSIEYLNRLLVAQDIQMLCLNVDNEELHQQANALPFAFRHGRHYSEPFQAWPFSSPAC